MLLMGLGRVVGAIAAQAGASLAGLDQQVGTNGSAAAAVLGVGLILAAFNPQGSISWVRAGILYGLVVVVFEVVSYFLGKSFHLGPVIFGLAFTLLLIASYPRRTQLIPTGIRATKPPITAQIKPARDA